MAWLVAQQPLGFADIGQRVTDVAGAEVPVNGLPAEMFGKPVPFPEDIAQAAIKLVEAGALAYRHVVHLVGGLGVGGGGGQDIGLDRIVDVAEVPAGFAVAVDIDRLFVEHGGDPLGDYRRVGPFRVLAAAEDVEVAQADGFESVAAVEDFGVEFVDVLGHRVGRERFADLIFQLGQAGVVAVGGAGGGVNQAGYLGVAGGGEHIEKAADVVFVGGDGVFQRAGHAAQSGLVEDVVDGNALRGDRFEICPQLGWGKTQRPPAVVQVADIALDEVEVLPLLRSNQALHLIQAVLVAGGEVVQPHHPLVELQHGFQQVGADEAGHPGDQPGFRIDLQVVEGLLVNAHKRNTWKF